MKNFGGLRGGLEACEAYFLDSVMKMDRMWDLHIFFPHIFFLPLFLADYRLTFVLACGGNNSA